MTRKRIHIDAKGTPPRGRGVNTYRILSSPERFEPYVMDENRYFGEGSELLPALEKCKPDAQTGDVIYVMVSHRVSITWEMWARWLFRMDWIALSRPPTFVEHHISLVFVFRDGVWMLIAPGTKEQPINV